MGRLTSLVRRMRRFAPSIVAGTLLAIAVYWLIRPEQHLSDERLYVFVGEGCPHAIEILRQLETDTAMLDYVIPVLAEAVNDDLSARVCDLVSYDIRRNAPWLKMFDKAWICHRVARWSQMTYERSFFKLPSWSVGRVPVAPQEEKMVLASQGVHRTDDPVLPLRVERLHDGVGNASSESATGSEPSHEPKSQKKSTSRRKSGFRSSQWRGQSIGF